jgi:RNA polymerase sigma factor (sigma-70 family)
MKKSKSMYRRDSVPDWLFSFPLLSREEERALIVKAQGGDESACNDLINANLRFVYSKADSICTKYSYRFDVMDLFQAGVLGLRKAIINYNPSKFDCRLLTYSAKSVSSKMFEYINKNSSAVRIPNPERRRKIETFSSDFLKLHGRRPLPREVSKGTGLSLNAISNFLPFEFFEPSCVSLDSEFENGGSLYDVLSSKDQNPREYSQGRELEGIVDDVKKAFDDSRLREREKRIFMKYVEDIHATYERVGETEGISRGRVEQIVSSVGRVLKIKLNGRARRFVD